MTSGGFTDDRMCRMACTICAVDINVSTKEIVGRRPVAWLCGTGCRDVWLTQRRLAGKRGVAFFGPGTLFAGAPK